MTTCPCGSQLTFAECCEPAITGTRPARTAEELMRSRYSAYVNLSTDYIYETTHPDHRQDYDPQGTREWAENSTWEGLEIVSTTAGGADDNRGTVEFIARYRDKDGARVHHELADFRKEGETWFFTDGRNVPQKPLISSKVGRNDPCTCGSGTKYKKCCGK